MTEFSVENIYYLGPDGSNAHAAMLKFLEKCNINVKNQKSQKNIRVAIDSLKQDFSSVCVLPIENSIQGIVRETIDNLLKNEDLKIRTQGEISLPIKHLLLAKTTEKSAIKKIFSHPQALAQCSNNLYEKYKSANSETEEAKAQMNFSQSEPKKDSSTIPNMSNMNKDEIDRLIAKYI
jgi:prephenate dehydratase